MHTDTHHHSPRGVATAAAVGEDPERATLGILVMASWDMLLLLLLYDGVIDDPNVPAAGCSAMLVVG